MNTYDESSKLPFTNEYDQFITRDDIGEAVRVAIDALLDVPRAVITLRDIGLLQFLNEREGNEPYASPHYFLGAAVSLRPNDADLRFWHGYVWQILTVGDNYSIAQYERGLEIDPQHAYCLIGLAGSGKISTERQIQVLDRALMQQPNNYRALMQRADLAANCGDVPTAISMYQKIIDHQPYHESGYGFMNEYMNGVLTKHALAANEKAEAVDKLKQLTDTQSGSRWSWRRGSRGRGR